MRTPNANCVICGKPLYRRPFELAKVRWVACLDHRDEAKRLYPLTEAQNKALKLGRKKGTNHLNGTHQSDETKRRRSMTTKRTYAACPEIAIERGKKNRGENHYNWKGGINRLNESIRGMTENRKWADGVKARDKTCVRCGSTIDLESHHIKPFVEILEENNVTNCNKARACRALWDLNNGITLCKKCHYKEHGRTFCED